MKKKDFIQLGGLFGIVLLTELFNLSFLTTVILVCIGWYLTEKKIVNTTREKKIWWFEFTIIMYLILLNIIILIISDINPFIFYIVSIFLYFGFKIWLIKRFPIPK